jgi:hypothetical protein
LLATFAEPIAALGSRSLVTGGKTVLAAIGAALLLLDLVLERRGRGARLRSLRNAALALVALASALAWWNFMQFHYLHYAHVSDTFHYFVGSKYFDELGHTRLYACTAIADAEAGAQTGVSERLLRNLESNRLEPTTAVLADPEACKRHFEDERWAAFSRDVAYFRGRVPTSRWHAIQRDHGYNAPPAWTSIGGALAATGPATDARILALGLLDPLLLAAMWAGVARVFGWRVLCVAVIFWGTNGFAGFGWTGGSFLRQSWLVASIAGICLLRRGKPASAGACLAAAAAFRIFPAALLVAVAARALWSVGRSPERRIDPAHLRFAAGAVATGAVIFTLSLAMLGGVAPWLAFVDNSRTHLATPLKNHVGLKTVLAHDTERADRLIHGGTAEERYREWRAAREARAAERVGSYWALVCAFGLLLVFAVRDQPDWVAATLGIGLIPVAFELTNYYYAILLGYGLLASRWPGVGPALLALSALGGVLVGRLQWQDEIMVWASVWVLAFVVFCTLLPIYRPPRPDSGEAGPRLSPPRDIAMQEAEWSR